MGYNVSAYSQWLGLKKIVMAFAEVIRSSPTYLFSYSFIDLLSNHRSNNSMTNFR